MQFFKDKKSKQTNIQKDVFNIYLGSVLNWVNIEWNISKKYRKLYTCTFSILHKYVILYFISSYQ